MAELRPIVETGAWATSQPPACRSFRDYVMTRKYDFGRGSRDAWRFIAFARGDSRFPDVNSWRELEAYLDQAGCSADFAASARSVWRSFTAYRSRELRLGERMPRSWR